MERKSRFAVVTFWNLERAKSFARIPIGKSLSRRARCWPWLGRCRKACCARASSTIDKIRQLPGSGAARVRRIGGGWSAAGPEILYQLLGGKGLRAAVAVGLLPLEQHALTGLDQDVAGNQGVGFVVLFVEKAQAILGGLDAAGYAAVIMHREKEHAHSRCCACSDASAFCRAVTAWGCGVGSGARASPAAGPAPTAVLSISVASSEQRQRASKNRPQKMLSHKTS